MSAKGSHNADASALRLPADPIQVDVPVGQVPVCAKELGVTVDGVNVLGVVHGQLFVLVQVRQNDTCGI